MRGVRRSLPLVLFPALLLLPTSASAFTVSLPSGSAVKIDSPSRLAFTVTNTGANEGLSRLVLRFPSGYRVTAGSAPPGWTVEPGPAGSTGEGGEITFRTTDEVKCSDAMGPGASRIFGVEVIAPASGSITPDGLVGAQGEQSCRGMILDAPVTLPSWDRLGIEAALGAGPPMVGLGGDVAVTMTVTNLSTVELTDVTALLSSTGTGSVSQLAGPAPGSLTLAPGGSGSLTWSGRATSPGTVSFSGQAVSQSVTSAAVRAEPVFVGDLEASLSVTPEQVASGQSVQVQMTVTNRGPVGVTNVTPSFLIFEGTATASAAAGPSPASAPVLEPGESSTFAWTAAISGGPGDTYAFSGSASAEGGVIVSAAPVSNGGVIAQQNTASEPGGGGTINGGGLASIETGTTGASAGTTAATTGGSSSTSPASASVQFVAVNHNGSQTGGAQFATPLVRNLRILVAWQNVSGGHTQRLDFFSPDGSLYQRVSVQFSGASSVETQLLVGGTWITEYSLFGAWRVEVYLDRNGMPTASSVFVLDP